MLLPPEKLAIIAINVTINSILRSHNNGAVVLVLSNDIAETIQTEFTAMVKIVQRKKEEKEKNEHNKDWRTELFSQLLEGGNRTRSVLVKIRKLMDMEEWPKELKIKLGSALLALLLQTAKYAPHNWRFNKGSIASMQDGSHKRMYSKDDLIKGVEAVPALQHSTGYVGTKRKRIGLIKLDPLLYDTLITSHAPGEMGYVKGDVSAAMVRYLPMITPPLPWKNSGNNSSPYYLLRTQLLRTYNKQQLHANQRSFIPAVLDCLNYVGSIPWKINKKVYQVIIDACNQGLALGNIV